MEARLTELNRNEILLYLGYRGQELTAEISEQIDRCVDAVCQAARPSFVYRRMPVSGGRIAGFPLEGRDIADLLAPCGEAILMAATLGAEVERLLMRTEVTDMADAVIMDACASAAIENVCDHFEFDMREELAGKGLYLTDRFSPGYGDLPLATQKAFCEALHADRRIGLTVTSGSIMTPRKSVTAVLGISEEPQVLRRRGCEVCSLFLDCSHRKEGRTCHG